MSPADPAQQQSSAASKKKNNKKKKNAAAKAQAAGDATKAENGPQDGDDRPDDDNDPEHGPDGPNQEEADAVQQQQPNDDQNESRVSPATNGHVAQTPSAPAASGDKPATETKGRESEDTSARLEAMSQERETLRAEVEQFRKQLESIQESHTQETTQLKSELEESEAAKEQAQEDYQNLLERVEKIKETVGQRLQRGKEELEEAQGRVEELEAQNDDLQKSCDSYQSEADGLKTELQDSNRELSSLRSRSNLSQHNSLKEKEDMTRQIQHMREEAEAAKDAMGDWEVLAMEERSIRESLSEKASALEEQVATLRESYEQAAADRDTQTNTVDGLQRALQEIQEARKRELRDAVESSEEQLQAMKKLVQEADTRATSAETSKETLQKELERTAPFEKEVKEKNLLIGKLRHEAIVLNEHLTKALRYLKKTKPEDSIDRQIVTNHFLQFLALDRSDPKKFQILQVISGLLNWTEEQREQAGLARPGASGSSLRLPVSPFHRTPSTPSLNTEFFSDTTTTSAREKETLSELWTSFLARSAEEGQAEGADKSRKASMSSMPAMPGSPRQDHK